MINLYAYTYPKYDLEKPGYILTKFGDSIRDVEVRMSEQGNAAEAFAKIVVGAWNNVKNIERDYVIHKILTKEGFHHKDGAGTEWFFIPGKTTQEAFEYLDNLIAKFEGTRVRNKVKLRTLQKKALDEAMEIIAKGVNVSTVIANLCPRFGKTIWALMLFNAIFEKYGNCVMLLPAYWLSVHTSFVDELEQFDDFLDIALIDPNKEGAEIAAAHALDNNQRIIIPVSLHGDYDEWTVKHDWIAQINNDDIFMFADEGDFGTHADNQKKKLDFIFA